MNTDCATASKKLEWQRNQKYIEIITKLNKKHRQGEANIFDCGELGFLHIWWHNQWKYDWFIPSLEFKSR